MLLVVAVELVSIAGRGSYMLLVVVVVMLSRCWSWWFHLVGRGGGGIGGAFRKPF